jgi:hypothetical protein
MTLDGVRSSCLGVEEDCPHVAGDIVNEKEVAPASRSSQGVANVTGPQRSPCTSSSFSLAEAHLVQEGQLALLRQHTCIVELLHVVDVRHSPRHPLSTELP